MSLDNKILELRLVTKDTAIGQASSLARCAAKLNNFKAFSTSESAKSAVAAFLREIFVYRLDLNKSCRLLRSSADQLAEYDRLEGVVQEKIDCTRKEIHQLLIELKQEQEIRKHRIQIETVAAEVNQHSSLSSLKRKIGEITDSMATTQESIVAIENDIITRKSQLDQLEHILTLLESKLEHDNDAANDDAENADQEGEEWDAGRETGNTDNDYKAQEGENYAEASEANDEGGDGGSIDTAIPNDS